ncbi:hypothetical protein [Pandoraea sp. NPDC087047]|uniref:hypothetical protein n=1 Tax=Pandoraea sp. NPDC087047 TaxID=3364390 RepID=UPI0037F4FC9F
MSDSLPQRSPASSASSPSAAPDDLLVQYERACAEMQLAGRKLHRQMQEYHAVLDEVARLEAEGTPQAREKLQRLEALVQSEAFQRDEREIRRMTAALGHAIERMRDDAPVPLADAGAAPALKRATAVRRVCA